MIPALRRTFAAELVKLGGLPAVRAGVLATVAAAAVLAAVLAASTVDGAADTVTIRTVPLLQAGPIVVGVLAVATEYEGLQIRTSLTATPARPLLLTAKGLAYLVAAATIAAAAIGAGLAAAWATSTLRHRPASLVEDGRHLAGSVAYLVLLGALGFGVALVLRSLVVPLVSMLALVFIVSPLLAASTDAARWLPDRAGRFLYLPEGHGEIPGGHGGLPAGPATLVLLTWLAATCLTGAAAFLARNA